MLERVAVGLGSNVGDRLGHLALGLRQMGRFVVELEASPVYETEPQLVVDQPAFLNAACIGRTKLNPRELLSYLKSVEGAAGRRRKALRYGPRRLDLDILLYGDEVIERPDLVIPHPALRERAFVLVPLGDIAAGWRVPGNRGHASATVAKLLSRVSTEGVRRTNLELACR